MYRPDEHQHRAREKRHPPAPREERRVVGQPRIADSAQIGEHQSERRAHLRKAGDEAAALRRGPLSRHQHRAAPLAADGEPLQRAAERQQHGAPDADRVVGRHQPDGHGRDAHHHHRRDEQRLASDAIAEVAEQSGAERARDEADEKRGERQHRPRRRDRRWKEQPRKHQRRGGAVQEEVVPLDRGADRRRDHRASEMPPPRVLVEMGRDRSGADHRATGSSSPTRRVPCPARVRCPRDCPSRG